MLKLSGRAIRSNVTCDRDLFRLSTDPDLPHALRTQYAFLARNSAFLPNGFAHYFFVDHAPENLAADISYTILDSEYSYLDNSDIVRISNEGMLRVLFRANSNHNSILMTEQCNNYCLMCSQPPKRADDSWIIEETKEFIPLIPRSTKSIGITGGEPTLLGDHFLEILGMLRAWLPQTAVHVLSNGRLFSDLAFSQKLVAISHPDLMIGIPVYSDDAAAHDYIVQAKGAFDETIRGILNLKKLNQKVEVRVVIHKQTAARLPKLAEFIARNLLFVDHVALMGLEMTGFTLANLDSLWIDPFEYKDELSEAVRTLANYGITTSVYNHQLCTINRDVESHYVKSISDWKNEFIPECNNCARLNECGGFFSSAIRTKHCANIRPFR